MLIDRIVLKSSWFTLIKRGMYVLILCALEKKLLIPYKIVKKGCLLFLQDDQDYYPGRRKRGKDYKKDMVRWMWCFFILIIYVTRR